MSVGRNLQEMENVVTKNAQSGEPMHKLSTGIAPGQTGSWEDLGGPTPENYTNEPNGSAKLKEPGGSLKQVSDAITNRKGKAAAMGMGHLAPGAVKEESEEDEEDLISEEEILEAAEEEEDEEEGSEEDKSEEDDKKKGGKKKDDEEKVEESFDIEEDVTALLAGEDLSEDFQIKAKTIFEAAIRSKVAVIKEQLQSVYEEKLVEELQEVKAELVERVDAYLEYVADEWIAENELAVQSGLKAEMTESFLVGMKGLFEDHYVSIPEEKYDVVESMVDKLDEMEEKLNEQIQRNVALNRRLAESVTDVIFGEVSESLALSQKDKLASLAENVEFDSEDSYREKLVTLRDSYFPRATSAQRNTVDNLAEEVNYNNDEAVSASMARYLQTMQRVSKK
jgi:hypothetical protein